MRKSHTSLLVIPITRRNRLGYLLLCKDIVQKLKRAYLVANDYADSIIADLSIRPIGVSGRFGIRIEWRASASREEGTGRGECQPKCKLCIQVGFSAGRSQSLVVLAPCGSSKNQVLNVLATTHLNTIN